MKDISNEAKEALVFLPDETLTEGAQLNRQQMDALTLVYGDILEVFNNQRRKVLSTACGGCVIEAKRLVRNYVNKFGRQSTEQGNAKVVKVVITSEYDGMNLKQLRGLFPNIKATSVKGFIKKINDGESF